MKFKGSHARQSRGRLDLCKVLTTIQGKPPESFRMASDVDSGVRERVV